LFKIVRNHTKRPKRCYR